MSSEWQLDNGIHSIKSAWRREHTARANLEKMLEQAEAENAKLRELCADMFDGMCDHDHCYTCHHWREGYNGCKYHERMAQLGIEVD